VKRKICGPYRKSNQEISEVWLVLWTSGKTKRVVSHEMPFDMRSQVCGAQFLIILLLFSLFNKGRYRSNWLRSQLKLLCATSVTYRFHTENPEISDASIQNVVARRIGACVLCTPDTIGGYKISYSLKFFVVFLSFCRKMP
jgi:hypothetical protein